MFSPKEVSRFMRGNADPSTVTRWCQSGKIEASKPMGRWLVTRSALAKLLVAFGLASHFVATGMQSCAKMMPPARAAFVKTLDAEADREG